MSRDKGNKTEKTKSPYMGIQRKAETANNPDVSVGYVCFWRKTGGNFSLMDPGMEEILEKAKEGSKHQ